MNVGVIEYQSCVEGNVYHYFFVIILTHSMFLGSVTVNFSRFFLDLKVICIFSPKIEND